MGHSQSVATPAPCIPFADSVYRTTPERVPLLARLFPSVCLYARFLHIVYSASAKAKMAKARWDRDMLVFRQIGDRG